MQNLVAAALCNLSRHDADGLMKFGDVIQALSTMAQAEDEDTRHVCAVALRNLSGHEASQEQMLEGAGGLEMLVQFMMGTGTGGAGGDFSRTANTEFQMMVRGSGRLAGGRCKPQTRV